MKKTRIAVAGAGLIGRTHIALAAASPSISLVAVVDPSPSAGAVATQFQVPLFPTLDALLAREQFDGIVLATPNALHVPQALQCLEAGLAVLLEKPIAPTVAEGVALVQRADALGGRLLIGHHRAHSPIMAKARAVIESGQLGRLVTVMGSATFLKPDHYFDDGPWRREPGGGPILINMIHEVHNLRILCGEIVAVQAIASHAVRGFAVEDTVAITLQFASGMLGSFMLSDTAASARNWSTPAGRTRPTPPARTRTVTCSRAPTAACRCRPCASRPTPAPRLARGGSRSRQGWSAWCARTRSSGRWSTSAPSCAARPGRW